MQEHRSPSPDRTSTFGYDDEDADTVVNPSANTPLDALIALDACSSDTPGFRRAKR